MASEDPHHISSGSLWPKITQLTGIPVTEVMTYNPEEPQNVVPRQALRELNGRVVSRLDFWARHRRLAPRPDPGPPDPGASNAGMLAAA